MNWQQLSLQFVFGGALSFAICYTVMSALIKVQREHIRELSHERDDYRDKLHSCRDELAATNLKLLELQSRPDLNDLGKIINENTNVLGLLSKKLSSRDGMFDRIEQAFQQTTEALKNLSILIERK